MPLAKTVASASSSAPSSASASAATGACPRPYGERAARLALERRRAVERRREPAEALSTRPRTSSESGSMPRSIPVNARSRRRAALGQARACRPPCTTAAADSASSAASPGIASARRAASWRLEVAAQVVGAALDREPLARRQLARRGRSRPRDRHSAAAARRRSSARCRARQGCCRRDRRAARSGRSPARARSRSARARRRDRRARARRAGAGAAPRSRRRRAGTCRDRSRRRARRRRAPPRRRPRWRAGRRPRTGRTLAAAKPNASVSSGERSSCSQRSSAKRIALPLVAGQQLVAVGRHARVEADEHRARLRRPPRRQQALAKPRSSPTGLPPAPSTAGMAW